MVRRETLTAVPGSRLAQLFCGRWDQHLKRDAEGRVFLDFSRLQFRSLLRFLADCQRGPGSRPAQFEDYEKALPEWSKPGFQSLCEFLCSPDTCNIDASGADLPAPALAARRRVFDSILANVEQQDLLSTWLAPGSGKPEEFRLLFRASRDGFSSQAFHQTCDGKGPTVVLAKSIEGHLFGGYTETSWDSSCRYKQSEQAFLFRLAGPEGSRVRPSKHPVTNPVAFIATQAIPQAAAAGQRAIFACFLQDMVSIVLSESGIRTVLKALAHGVEVSHSLQRQHGW